MALAFSILLATAATVSILGLAACLWMLHRNERVFRFRQDVLARMSEAAQQDIRSGRDWKWRYATYERVPYGDMMRQFWKPLDVVTWYDSDDFLRATAEVH